MIETASRPDAAAIQHFSRRARKLRLERHVGHQWLHAPKTRPDHGALETFICAARSKIEERNSRFRHNPWKMAGLGRYEVRNSAVLGQLFDRTISPVAGPLFLGRYLKIVSERNSYAALPMIDQQSDYRICIEHCPMGRQSERVDLTVEGASFVIGIEIKIDAGEGPDQLDRYLEVIRERADLRRCEFRPVIYLSPRSSGRSGDVLESSWEDIGRAAEQACREIEESNARAAWLLRCFAEHVRDFY